jgi:hypothetical protein
MNYDNVVDRHTVNMQVYNEVSVVSIPKRRSSVPNSLFREALDDFGRDVQEEDGGNEGE